MSETKWQNNFRCAFTVHSHCAALLNCNQRTLSFLLERYSQVYFLLHNFLNLNVSFLQPSNQRSLRCVTHGLITRVIVQLK